MRSMQKFLTMFVLSFAAFAVLADELTIVSWGGAYSMSQRKAFHEPFMKETGHVILEDEWAGDVSQIRAQVETGNYKWDVIDSYPHDAINGCDEDYLERIDAEKLGLSADDFVDGGFLECGIGGITWSTILAYRTDVFPDGPKNWNDFWDIAKFPGKRGMYRQPTANLETALMADGVPLDQIYDTLRTTEGVNRAFAKLNEIKEHIIWWETGAQPAQLLADGEVSMTTAWNGRIYSAIVEDGQPFEIVWDGQTFDFGFWVVPKDHPKRDLIYEFLKFASRLDRQGDQTNYISYGNTRKGTEPFINPDILPHLPTAPGNLANALAVDVKFWVEYEEELNSRFNVWVAK